MGESAACLVHSFSYSASISRESHEDDPLHSLNQSVSFGRFMTESLEWGKWSSFSHKKYVEEAEKFSRPGSVAQKKAFFEAHYKRIAEAKKAATAAANEPPQQQAAGATVSSNASESDAAQKQEERTKGSELNVEKNEPGIKIVETDSSISGKVTAAESLFRKSIVADDDMVPGEMEENRNCAKIGLRRKSGSVGYEDEDEDSSEKDGSVGVKIKDRRSVTKSSPGWRVSVEISVPPKKVSFPDNRSERTVAAHDSFKKYERPVPVRQRFNLLNCLMTKSKPRDQNATRERGREQGNKPKKWSLCLCYKPQKLG